ncbi:AAA family ATPase [Alteromonas oceani]|uniref:AAA family ATPase n=1 Tax=Alteromonas oceani TaxID=2071609 RepID=A0ABV7JVL5_9ALTE|nr:AAA family ATPase [Alteromonas oceani]
MRNVKVLDYDLAENVIRHLKGYLGLSTLNADEIDILPLVTSFRNCLVNVNENEIINRTHEIYKLVSSDFKLKVEQSFAEEAIKEQQERMVPPEFSVDDFDALFDKPDSPTPSSPSLNLKEIYTKVGGITKQFFDEISVVVCGQYLQAQLGKDINDLSVKHIPEVEVSSLFAAIMNIPEMLLELAEYFHCQPSQLIMPENVYSKRTYLLENAVTRSFSVNDVSKTWYSIASSYALYLNFTDEAQQCVNQISELKGVVGSEFVDKLMRLNLPFITQLKQLNHSKNAIAKAVKISQALNRELNKKIIGQVKAVSHLSNGYLSSSLVSPDGPRLIYTFAGPSGVGKTYLGSSFCELLNQHEQSGYAFTEFNMEQYSHEKDAMKLFGTGVQYTDASLGTLTSKVRACPRHILLFDEIEKAHNTVIQTLLGMLDKGVAQDQTSQELINFKQCIVIFTSNLGQDVLAKNTQGHALNVFDVLRQTANPSSGTKLSFEFINRLAKGYSVLFSSLRANHYLHIAEQAVNQSAKTNHNVTFYWPMRFSSFLVRALAPEISARQLGTILSKIKADILTKSADLLDEQSDIIEFTVTVNESTSQAEARQMLLFDNDKRLHDALNVLDTNVNINHVSTLESLPDQMKHQRPDALLIDSESVSQSQTSLSEIIEKVREQNSSIPIFTYQLAQLEKALQTDNDCVDVLEHFSIQLDDIKEGFKELLGKVNHYLTVDKTIQRMLSRNEALDYTLSVDKRDNKLVATFDNLHYKQLIQSKDLQESTLFQQSLPSATLDDVIGLERAKMRLTEVIGWLRYPEKLSNFGIKIPTGFLYAGPPGTGKTLLAKAVAGECKLPFFSASAAELSSPHSSGTTENIKSVFAVARKYAPSILFIDEIDAIAGKRTANNDGASRDRNLTVNALLTEMDGFTTQQEPVFVMAATNHPHLLDDALTRPGRFDEIIYCDLPNKEARRIFFERFANKHNLSWPNETVDQLANVSQGMSAAQIDQVLRESIYQAVGNNETLSTEHVKDTIVRIVYGSPSDHITLSTEEKNRTAYHEAAHLVTHKLLFPTHPVDFVTIEPRNQALGFVATRSPDEYESLSKQKVHDQLQVLLAGKVGEAICSGDQNQVSTGASNDIEKATRLAMHAIYEGGLEPSVGSVNVAMLTKYEESELLSNAQNAVKTWLANAEENVTALLLNHTDQLERVATRLIEKESLLKDEIDKLFV